MKFCMAGLSSFFWKQFHLLLEWLKALTLRIANIFLSKNSIYTSLTASALPIQHVNIQDVQAPNIPTIAQMDNRGMIPHHTRFNMNFIQPDRHDIAVNRAFHGTTVGAVIENNPNAEPWSRLRLYFDFRPGSQYHHIQRRSVFVNLNEMSTDNAIAIPSTFNPAQDPNPLANIQNCRVLLYADPDNNSVSFMLSFHRRFIRYDGYNRYLYLFAEHTANNVWECVAG